MLQKCVLLVFLSCFVLSSAKGQSVAEKRSREARLSTADQCEYGTATADLDANNVRAPMYDNGNLFWRGSGNIYEVPKGEGIQSIFSYSLNIGGMVGGELRYAGSDYGPWEFWPGPLDEEGNPPEDCSTYDRIFKISRSDLERYESTGEATQDVLDWPWTLGAPVEDGDGVANNYDLAAGDRPKLFGDQTLWWVMNDAAGRHGTSQAKPIGLEVQVTAYAYHTDNALDNTTFYRYRLIYKGDGPLTNAYFGIWTDMDLGEPGDDFIGSDTLRDMGFIYNGDNFDDVDRDRGYGSAPPALGNVFVQGPIGDPDRRDNDRDGEIDESGERLGMSKFVYYNGDSSPFGNPASGLETYNYLRGIWRDGLPMTMGGNGYGGTKLTNYIYSGDPATMAYWSEENTNGRGDRNQPADRRFVMSTGPFTMEHGEEEEIVVAIVWSRHVNRLLSIRQLRRDVDFVRAFFQGDAYDYPALPAPPRQVVPVSPVDDARNVSTDTYFAWQMPSDSLYYLLQLSKSPSFESLAGESLVFDSRSASMALENNTTYYWRVRAENDGGAGPWSPVRMLETGYSRAPREGISRFEVVANAAGPLDPPGQGTFAFNSNGFPTVDGAPPHCADDSRINYALCNDRPTEEQQVGPGRWGINVGGGDGTYVSYLVRSLRGTNRTRIGLFDFEWRFTGTSTAVRGFEDDAVMTVPFEIWNTGVGTPDDPSDDVRMIPLICEAACGGGRVDLTFDVGGDHPVSGGANDPVSDWIYWHNPRNMSPGDAGYQAFAESAVRGDIDAAYGQLGGEVLARQVVVGFNLGSEPPYPQALPEEGTVFRISTVKVPDLHLEAHLSGLNADPPIATQGQANVTATQTWDHVEFEGTFSGLTGKFLGIAPANGEPNLDVDVELSEDGRSGTFRGTATCCLSSLIIKSTAFREGEIEGRLLPAPNAAPGPPQILAPAAGASLLLAGDKDQAFEVSWIPSGDRNGNKVVFLWQLAAAPDFREPLLTRQVGESTVFRTTYGSLDAVLERLGVAEGGAVTLYHRVIASDLSLAQYGETQTLRLTRGVVTGVEEDGELPHEFALHGNYPNPFNPSTTIRFDLPAPADVRIEIYDLLGRRVLSLPARSVSAGASRALSIDASSLASGVYLYRLTARGASTTWRDSGRMVLVK